MEKTYTRAPFLRVFKAMISIETYLFQRNYFLLSSFGSDFFFVSVFLKIGLPGTVGLILLKSGFMTKLPKSWLGSSFNFYKSNNVCPENGGASPGSITLGWKLSLASMLSIFELNVCIRDSSCCTYSFMGSLLGSKAWRVTD